MPKLVHRPINSDGLSDGRRGGSRAASTHQIYSDDVLERVLPGELAGERGDLCRISVNRLMLGSKRVLMITPQRHEAHKDRTGRLGTAVPFVPLWCMSKLVAGFLNGFGEDTFHWRPTYRVQR